MLMVAYIAEHEQNKSCQFMNDTITPVPVKKSPQNMGYYITWICAKCWCNDTKHTSEHIWRNI